MTVNTEFVERWCDALESGEYPQTRFVLHRLTPTETDLGDTIPAGYCCIGVACTIAGIQEQVAEVGGRRVGLFEGDEATAPLSLRRLVGPLLWLDWSQMNDAGSSFKEIAARLRSEYLA